MEKFIGNFGDYSYLDYGGFLVFQDTEDLSYCVFRFMNLYDTIGERDAQDIGDVCEESNWLDIFYVDQIDLAEFRADEGLQNFADIDRDYDDLAFVISAVQYGSADREDYGFGCGTVLSTYDDAIRVLLDVAQGGEIENPEDLLNLIRDYKEI